jgi:hypothetical protein
MIKKAIPPSSSNAAAPAIRSTPPDLEVLSVVVLVAVVCVGVVSVWVCPSVNSLNALEPPRAANVVAGAASASVRIAHTDRQASARLDTRRAYRLRLARRAPAQTVE